VQPLSDDQINALIEEKNRVVRENWRFRGLVGRLKAVRKGCKAMVCNIGGGLCDACGQTEYGILNELEAMA